MKIGVKTLAIVAMLAVSPAAYAIKPHHTAGQRPPVLVSFPKPPTGGPLKPIVVEWWPLECWLRWPRARQTCETR